ncbi:B12-binding domain-containing radical SAM protein [Candidatus Bathyarchaeota archaeon]|nr:B12-binding domain-containing radical SAM protein [Candidatus Bathyarchaeota archaeon]
MKPSGRRGLGFLFDSIPLGLEYIAAFIEEVVEDIRIIDMELERKPFQSFIDLYQPDLIGITMCATDHTEGLHLARIAKGNGIATVLGGYHPTSIPKLLLACQEVDMVVRGEGELTMRELVQKGSPQDVLGVSYKKDGITIHNADRPLIRDLDILPFPARHLRRHSYRDIVRPKEYDVLLTSRGCLGKCNFCCEPFMSQGCLRCRSPKNVMEEILEISKYHRGKPVKIMIADPNFMADPKRVSRLCDLLQEHNLNVTFSALVRADSMARNPEVVRKMCEAGIASFEMGIESPITGDLMSTNKGLNLSFHRKAIQVIRENGGNAGGTLIIGLPDHTENDIRRFPEYAKEIGLTAAAFGIVTPFPGTKFYEELDKDGVIFETDWDKFDEMHSVYQTRHLSNEKIEELATFCMAKFWTLDTFIDRAKVFQKRTGEKTPLINFILERAHEAGFLLNAGGEVKKESFGQYVKIFLRAYADPSVEVYTREVGVHNIIEMSRFLHILGPQKIQCTLRFDDETTSFVFRTTKETVEYIKVMNGREDNSTLDFYFDLKEIRRDYQESSVWVIRKLWKAFRDKGRLGGIWNLFRLLLAVGVETFSWKLTNSE